MWSPNIEVKRQTGLLRCIPRQYDNVLYRFIVNKDDSYCGIESPEALVFERDVPIFACRFAESTVHTNILAVANENGVVAIQDTNLLNNQHVHTLQCHENAVFDVAWMPQQLKFLTVSGDHTCRLWSIGDGDIREVNTFLGHSKSVKTAVFRQNDPNVFATGARDGRILIWDARIPHASPRGIENSIANCHTFNTPLSKRKYLSNRANSITGLVFQDDLTLISCGAGDGNIKVWDLRKNYSAYKKDPLPKHSIPYCGSSSKNGYTNLLLDKAGIRLYANCMDNVIYCFNVSTYSVIPEQRYTGHENNTFYIKSSLSSDSNYLVSGSSDEKAYIWNVHYSEPIVSLNGHKAEVTCASWCQNMDLKIVTCSDDSRCNVWRIGKEYPESADLTDLQGKAEAVTTFEKQGKSPWGLLDKTPQSSKSKPHGSGSHNSNRKMFNTPGNSSGNSDYYYGTSVTKKSSKRNLFNMLNSSLDNIKEQVDDEQASCSKMLKENDRNILNSPQTPTKSSADNMFSSPTANLPNFMLTGEAPHLRLMSPIKSSGSSVDWLTKIRQRKTSEQSSPKASIVQNNNLDVSRTRNSASKDANRTPGRRKCNTTLLKYFSPSPKMNKS